MTTRSAARKMKPADPGPIAAYKSILRDCIDRRPAGLRARIATALGKHKSFVSQLTNPVYPMPVPARHVETIFEICHFSPEERRSFLKAYARAHPEKSAEAAAQEKDSGPPPTPGRKTLTLEIPALGDSRKQRALESLLREFAERLAELLD
jgi:hypothetical protein